MAPPKYLIRDYRPEDFPELCRIDRACFRPGVAWPPEKMAAALKSATVVLVGENRRKRVVAFLIARHGYVLTVDVLPRYRERGFGRELLLRCEERLRAAGVRKVHLETAVDNVAAQSLYRSLGYTCVKRIPRYYPGGADAWRMEKTL